ncbi:MAG: glycosyltransferase family 2 protein [Desulforhopalus sp.]
MSRIQDRYSLTAAIPTLNGEKTLVEFFKSLGTQTITPDEILVADSSSTDSTVEICRANGATVFSIARSEFDHGGTRTFLAKKAAGTIILFFTQDAILASNSALELLIEPLLASDNIGCCYGRQLPRADAGAIAAHLRHFNYPLDSSVRRFDDRSLYGLKTVFISNSFAAYKKHSLASVGFFKNGLIFGEDTCTLGKLLMAGHNVAYVSEAAVYHSHNYTLMEEFKRSFDIGVLHSSESWLLDTYGKAEGIGKHYMRSIFSRLFAEKRYLLMADCLVRSFSKFLGYKLGKSYRKIPAALCPACSLHRLWWHKNGQHGRRTG